MEATTEIQVDPGASTSESTPPVPPASSAPVAPPLPPADDEDDQVDLVELGAVCGDIYADVVGAYAGFRFKVDFELSEKRIQRRGPQIALVLRKLGWTDSEIIAYLGLAAGVLGDLALVERAANDQAAKATPPEEPSPKT